MTLESSLWVAFRQALPARCHAVRIENEVEIGTPDVNFCLTVDYWVELKVQEAPKRAKTKFKIDHFTIEQRQWLVDRCRAGGNAFLLVQVGFVYLWLRGDVAAVWVGHCTFTELLNKCTWHGSSLTGLVEFLQR